MPCDYSPAHHKLRLGFLALDYLIFEPWPHDYLTSMDTLVLDIIHAL
jgi:hypothetical protein